MGSRDALEFIEKVRVQGKTLTRKDFMSERRDVQFIVGNAEKSMITEHLSYLIHDVLMRYIRDM